MATKFKALILAFIFLQSASCFADQLKILDSMGLTRAIKKIDGSVVVVVKSRPGTSAASLSLINVDGVLPDIAGADAGQGVIRFEGVQEGTWRITSVDKVEIGQVTIQK